MEKTSRRDFIRNSVIITLLGPVCATLSMKELYAETRGGDKIPFDQQSISQLFGDPAKNKLLAIEIRKDFKGFMRSKFALSPAQLRQLDSFREADIARIKEALEPVGRFGGRINVQISQRPISSVMAQNNFTSYSGRSIKIDVETKNGKETKKMHVEAKD